MIDPSQGPFLFDTSAESWLARAEDPAAAAWLRGYLDRFTIHVSAMTVAERIRGYRLLWDRSPAGRKPAIEAARRAYLEALGKVWPVDAAAAAAAGEILALIPDPPTPPRRSHKLMESRSSRTARWRFDVLIAATSLVTKLPLIHNNAADFETIRGEIEKHPGRLPLLGPLELIHCRRLISH